MPSKYFLHDGETFAEVHTPPGPTIRLPGDQYTVHVPDHAVEAVQDAVAAGRMPAVDPSWDWEWGRPADTQSEPHPVPDTAFYETSPLVIPPPPDFDPDTYKGRFMPEDRRRRLQQEYDEWVRKSTRGVGIKPATPSYLNPPPPGE